jgi:hypothetical protein
MIDLNCLAELEGKTVVAHRYDLDSEDGVTSLTLYFQQGPELTISPQGFGLALAVTQEYAGPLRP